MTKRKFMLVVLTCILTLTFSFSFVNADEGDVSIVAEGTCGENLTWVLDSNEVLTVSGTGEMTDFSIPDAEPNRMYYGGLLDSKYNSRLNKVIIEEGVTSVGNHALQNFWIREIVLPASLERIGDHAFRGINIGTVSLPEGSQLKEIGAYSFENAHVLHTVDLSKCLELTKISDNAFYSCEGLAYISLPYGKLDSVGNSAFEACESLSQVVLPETLGTIGDRAFAKCSSLISIYVPGSVHTYGEKVFDKCGSLAVFGVADSKAQELAKSNNMRFVAGTPDQNPVIIKQGKCGENVEWALDTKGTLKIFGTGEMQAYASASFTPWFKDSDSVSTVIVEEGVTHITREAFCDFKVLTEVSLPKSLVHIADYAFTGCKSLKEIVIPENVTYVGGHAFYYNTSAKYIYIPASVSFIGEYAFYQLGALESFEVSPDNASFTADENGVLYDKEKTALLVYPAGSSAKSFTIPETVKSIAPNAFSNAQNIEELIFSDGCKITELGYSTFASCNLLNNIVLNDGLVEIGANAFYGCDSLETVVVPESVSVIGPNAFAQTKLKSISLPGVKTVGSGAFNQCYSLESVEMPMAESIGEMAFNNCSSLRNITIPKGVASIGNMAFMYCPVLENISVAPENAFYCSDQAGVLYTKDMTRLIKYPSACSITEYAIAETVTSIDDNAFWGAKNLTLVTLPQALYQIGSQAFGECTGLTAITFPKSLTAVGKGAFMRCTNLATVIIPEDSQLQIIQGNTFGGCAIKEFTVPASVTAIAAYGLSGMEKVTVSEGTNLSYIGYSSFNKNVDLSIPQGSPAEAAAQKSGVNYRYTSSITVLVDGKTVGFDQHPIIMNDRVMVPMRAIFEALGAQVTWEHETYTAHAEKADVAVSIAIGKAELLKDGKSIAIDSPAILISNRTMLPVRAVSEAFGYDVSWNEDSRTVVITTK